MTYDGWVSLTWQMPSSTTPPSAPQPTGDAAAGAAMTSAPAISNAAAALIRMGSAYRPTGGCTADEGDGPRGRPVADPGDHQ